MLEGIGPKLLLILVVGFTIVLIGVGISTDVFTTQNTDKSLVIRAVGDVTTTPDKFAGQKITVMGYYYQGDLPLGYGYITSDPVSQPIIQGSLNNVDFLIVNLSAYNTSLIEGVLYYFTGLFVASYDTVYQGASYTLLLETVVQP
jgi:hypothetical protein